MQIISNNKLEKRTSIPYTHDIEDFKFIGVLLDALGILLGLLVSRKPLERPFQKVFLFSN